MSLSHTSMNTEFVCVDKRRQLELSITMRHSWPLSITWVNFPPKISLHLSLLCGLRTGEVDQSCLTDALGVSLEGCQAWETTDNLKASVGMEIT